MYNLSVLLKMDLPLIMQEPYSGVHRKCVYLPLHIKDEVDVWCQHQDGVMKSMLTCVDDVESSVGELFIEDAINLIRGFTLEWKKRLIKFYFDDKTVWSYKRNIKPPELQSHFNFICKSHIDYYVCANYPMLSPLLSLSLDDAINEYVNMLI